MSKPPAVEARVVQLQSHIQVLEQKLQDQEDQYHRDLNLIKQQLAELHLLFTNSLRSAANGDDSVSTHPIVSAPKLNLSVADVIAYAEQKQQTSQNPKFYQVLAETCKSIDNGAQLRVIEDLQSLIPQLSKCTAFLQSYQDLLMAIATKRDISPEDSTVAFLKAIGLPLLHTSQIIPSISAAVFYPLGDIDPKNSTFVSFHGFSKIHLLASMMSSYPLSLTGQQDSWFPKLLNALRLVVRIDYHLLSTFKEFREVNANGLECPPDSISERRGETNAVYNYLYRKAADLSNSADPKLNFNDFYYWLLFIIHALYQAEHIEVFALRHPLVNFVLGDDTFFTLLKTANDFLSDPQILQLTQDANDYPTYQSFFTRQFNDGEFVQPTAYNNKPQAYLQLATNNDQLFQFKWAPIIAKILSRDLTL